MIEDIIKSFDGLKKKINKNIHKSSQDTIPYIAIETGGIIEISKGYFSRTIKFSDINYSIARQEDQENIFIRYCKILNLFDSSFNIQITINNRQVDEENFDENLEINLQNDSLDIYRKEFNTILRKQLSEGKNNIKKDMYITLSTKAKNFKEAELKFAKLENEIQANFRRLGSNTKVQDLSERLEVIHNFLREEKFNFDENCITKNGISTKSVVAPDSFEFKKDYFLINNKYARALFIKDLPSYLSDDFLNNIMEINKNVMTSIFIRPIEPYKALKMVTRQKTGMDTNKIQYEKRSLRNGYIDPFIPYELRNSLEEAEELLDDLKNKNQKMFLVSTIIVHTASSKKELDVDTEYLKSIARKHVCNLGNLNYQQEAALRSVLPLGNLELKIDRALTTESTAIFMPFSSQELIQKNGMYYGKNAVSRNLLLFDRKTLKTPNGFILGTPGSGKSFSAKREMVNVLLSTNDDVIVIDPEREYARIAQNLHGEVIHISAGSKNYINPMDLSSSYSDYDPLLLKSDFVLSLCECLLGGKTGLTPKERTIIDRCVKQTYHKFFNSNCNKDDIPTLLDFQKVLEKQSEKEAKDLAIALELYTKGSLSIFANKTNVDTDNRFIVYDIKDLGKQLKTMGMLIVLDAVWNRVTLNREKGKRTWIYMDEIYLLFTNEHSAQFLFELYKRARKWGAIPTGITQNVEDLLLSELARKMLSNSDFILMLNQATSDRLELARLLNISDTQLSYITNSNEGEGLLFSGNSIIPFIDKFPQNTELYRMMTTKIEEV